MKKSALVLDAGYLTLLTKFQNKEEHQGEKKHRPMQKICSSSELSSVAALIINVRSEMKNYSLNVF